MGWVGQFIPQCCVNAYLLSRFSKNKASMETPSPKNSTTLSTHFLKEKEEGKNPTISWKFLKTNIPTFNPVTELCMLCTIEKFHILFKPESATLNSRNEIFSACRHKRAELLVPPDPKSQGGWVLGLVKVIQSISKYILFSWYLSDEWWCYHYETLCNRLNS